MSEVKDKDVVLTNSGKAVVLEIKTKSEEINEKLDRLEQLIKLLP